MGYAVSHSPDWPRLPGGIGHIGDPFESESRANFILNELFDLFKLGQVFGRDGEVGFVLSLAVAGWSCNEVGLERRKRMEQEKAY